MKSCRLIFSAAILSLLSAGDAVPTQAVAAADRKTSRLEVIERAPGDGTVLRASALLDERQGGEWHMR
ncbi:MAG: hypothetical protein HY717_18890 [Planctomycetes bacterium]|nr:hypothetical protein [Planctomycetota bacterium]